MFLLLTPFILAGHLFLRLEYVSLFGAWSHRSPIHELPNIKKFAVAFCGEQNAKKSYQAAHTSYFTEYQSLHTRAFLAGLLADNLLLFGLFVAYNTCLN